MAIFIVILMAGFTGLLYIGVKAWEQGWARGDSIEGPDGYTYCIMHETGMMQDPGDKLIRTKDLEAEESYEELGQKSTTSSWLAIIRPDNVKPRQLYITSKNLVVAVSYKNKACFAYDIDDNRFYGYDEIDKMSPFLLVKKETKLYEPDVFAVIMRVVEDVDCFTDYKKQYVGDGSEVNKTREYLPGCPNPEVLQAGLDHPNKEVQKISKWLLEIQNEGLASPSSTIREILNYVFKGLASENKTVRLNAIEICGYFQNNYIEKSIPILEEIVHEKDADAPTVMSQAAISLGRLGEPAFPILLRLIKSEDSSLRFYGALGFRFAGPKAKVYEKEIELLLSDRKSSVRQQAELALENMNKNG